jgi:alpha-1,2-mannosyltransferase
MDSPALRRHWPILVLAGLFGLYGWAMVVATGSGHDGVIGPRFNALGVDWVIFLSAARAFFTGDLSHIYNQAWITEATNSQFADWLSVPLPHPLFPYPPLYLLLVLPFAKLSVGWSLFLSQLAQFVALAWALRKLAPGQPYLFFLIGVFLCPAASNNVVAGSNAVLVTALIVGGFSLLDARPLLAGLLLGIVIFKPQYFPLLALAVIAANQKRALIGIAASITVLFLLSAMLFGPSLWLDWINVYLHPQQVEGINGTDWGHSWDDSVSTCVSLLGAPHWMATAAQALAGIVALAVTWRAFRLRHPQRLAILLCAALLASPHVSNYDLLFMGVAALIYAVTLPENSRPLALLLPAVAWAGSIYNPPRLTQAGLITPLVLLGLIWLLFQGVPGKSPLGDQKPLPAP